MKGATTLSWKEELDYGAIVAELKLTRWPGSYLLELEFMANNNLFFAEGEKKK